MASLNRRAALKAGAAAAALAAIGGAGTPEALGKCVTVPLDSVAHVGGSFTLTYAGYTTRALAFDCSAEEVAAALTEASGVSFEARREPGAPYIDIGPVPEPAVYEQPEPGNAP